MPVNAERPTLMIRNGLPMGLLGPQASLLSRARHLPLRLSAGSGRSQCRLHDVGSVGDPIPWCFASADMTKQLAGHVNRPPGQHIPPVTDHVVDHVGQGSSPYSRCPPSWCRRLRLGGCHFGGHKSPSGQLPGYRTRLSLDVLVLSRSSLVGGHPPARFAPSESSFISLPLFGLRELARPQCPSSSRRRRRASSTSAASAGVARSRNWR